jgi:hypothetical protein
MRVVARTTRCWFLAARLEVARAKSARRWRWGGGRTALPRSSLGAVSDARGGSCPSCCSMPPAAVAHPRPCRSSTRPAAAQQGNPLPRGPADDRGDHRRHAPRRRRHPWPQRRVGAGCIQSNGAARPATAGGQTGAPRVSRHGGTPSRSIVCARRGNIILKPPNDPHGSRTNAMARQQVVVTAGPGSSERCDSRGGEAADRRSRKPQGRLVERRCGVWLERFVH